MKWVFPRNDGGRDSGFHDAGLETFKGNFDRYLARELIQNSLDARIDKSKPAHVKFELIDLQRDEIPGMDYLKDTFERCADYWEEHAKVRAFFDHAAKVASRPRLRALRVGDYNTTGVSGTDVDRKKNWYHLIKCAGSSSKWGGEGGSFGIGKNAPFAASSLRTVLYTTVTTDGQYAFQGVSMLVSHRLPDGATAQATGYLGGDHGESIRVPEDIPRAFRRSDSGLDIIALEYPAAPSWENDLTYSVLDNFWPAIDFGDLIVSVGKHAIDATNLSKWLASFSGQEDFTAHLFYNAYKSPSQEFHERLPRLHETSLYLSIGDVDLPKRVAMVRETGMVIYQRGYLRSVVPFCGVFLCRNSEGNRLLRDMEPPRHDTWDPDHPQRGANKKIEIEYMTFIRECIKKLVPVDDSKVISIPGLNRFLPDDDETPEEAFGDDEYASKDETPNRSSLPQKIEGRTIDPHRQTMQPDRSKPNGGEEEIEVEGTGEGDRGTDSTKTGGGQGGNGGGTGGDRGTKTTGGAGGTQPKIAIPVHYRTFAKDAAEGVYCLVVARQENDSAPASLLVSTVGDDQKAPAEIKSARLPDGTPVPIARTGVLGPVELVPGDTLRMEITLAEPDRVAMEVVAYEA